MKVDYDFLLKEIEREIKAIETQITIEVTAGNVVKEAAERGEKTAFIKMAKWINRIRKIET